MVRLRRVVAPEPVLITNAGLNRSDEFRGRRRQYTIVMSTRVVCFILAVVVQVTWLRVVFIVGALVLPWVAVVAANQVQSKVSATPALYVPRPRRALGAGEEPRPRSADRRP